LINRKDVNQGELTVKMKKAILSILLAYAVISLACVYVVLPEGLESSGTSNKGKTGWNAFVTNIGKSDNGDLHIGITIRNDTGDWSAMEVLENKTATLVSNGKNTSCDTVFLSTGGHRVAPGFQMRGYTAGTKAEPVTQLIYVECAGADVTPGSRLTIPYSYVIGQYNYYEQDKNKVESNLEIALDEISSNLAYPVAKQFEGLIQQPDIEIVAINKVILTLTSVERNENILQFNWKTSNPGEYPTYVHIGNPPVIGDDGILYGFYQTPDIIIVPITPANGTTEWTTQVAVPQDVHNLYIMLSVETGKARLFANYCIDITDQ
jgi:hypothetical protein